MFAAEVLSQLRTLNWLAQEVQRVPAETREGCLLREQIQAVRARLPHAILAHHDQLAARVQITAAQVQGESCGVCQGRLPEALRVELAQVGHFGVCPQCGVFLWCGESAGRTVHPAAGGDAAAGDQH